MKHILVVCPQERDVRAILAAGLDRRYHVHYAGADLDAVEDFDPAAFVEDCDRIPADGVVGTKDRSALLAALIAERRGLPGPKPRALTACQFKPTARALERATVPSATPRFALLDGRPPFGPPFFVKPVVGRLSQRARRIDDAGEIDRLADRDSYMDGYARIAALAGLHPDAVRGFLAEELLDGDEVTLEGYVYGGAVVTIGITDSVKYPGTNSFERFEYPTALPPERQAELRDIADRVLPELGFDGEDPAWEPRPPHGVGLSYIVRVFEDAHVDSVPVPDDDVELLVRPGRLLSEQGTNDLKSYRLCIFPAWGPTRSEAVRRARERAGRLEFRLSPVGAGIA